MEDVLESVRRIVYRWVNTQATLLTNANPGDNIITVESTKRWLKGDELALVQYDNNRHQPRLYVKDILDNNRIQLTEPIRGTMSWTTSDNTVIRKTFDSQFFEAIYIGDVDVIPMFPAMTIMGKNKTSEWFTLGSTKEAYDLQITLFVKKESNEKSYRSLLRLTNTVEKGLKNNIFPLIGDVDISNLTANYIQGDTFIKVADSSIYKENQSVLIENLHRAEESAVKCIVDSTTLQLHMPFSHSYSIDDESKIIGLNRFIFNSWPASIDYGHIHKGSLLHASTIQWFAWEQEIQESGGWKDPQLT